jgi:hypothetical protein
MLTEKKKLAVLVVLVRAEHSTSFTGGEKFSLGFSHFPLFSLEEFSVKICFSFPPTADQCRSFPRRSFQ